MKRRGRRSHATDTTRAETQQEAKSAMHGPKLRMLTGTLFQIAAVGMMSFSQGCGTSNGGGSGGSGGSGGYGY